MTVYQHISSRFERIGARARIRRLDRATSRRSQQPLEIDVAENGRGEFFDIALADEVRLEVLDVRSRDRHLLLSASNWRGEDRFLCGHDEYHWFVAALPGDADPREVSAAKDALKPALVTRIESRKRRGKRPRKSDVYMRQGEWFFIPWRHAPIDAEHVTLGWLRRPGGKPHVCQFMYEDGEREYVCDRYPGLAFFETEYRQILRTRKKAKQWNWRPLRFAPDVYVKGWIGHEDHSSLFLDVWHRVEMNNESTSLSMSRMIYLD